MREQLHAAPFPFPKDNAFANDTRFREHVPRAGSLRLEAGTNWRRAEVKEVPYCANRSLLGEARSGIDDSRLASVVTSMPGQSGYTFRLSVLKSLISANVLYFLVSELPPGGYFPIPSASFTFY